MRLIFAGTPDFAAVQLQALAAAGHEVVLVLTQPDRPRGRGLKLTPSPVKAAAQALGLPLWQPEHLKDPHLGATLAAAGAEAMVVAAYGILLPPAVLDLFPRGCINVHASLLPRWRGAAPIQRAILAGDPETGITIMQMDAGLDTGDMLARAALPITEADTAQALHDRLALLGAQLLVDTLAGLAAGQVHATPQDPAQATYAAKLTKEEARINWREPASLVARKIRAYNPVPVAWSMLSGERIRLWAGHPVDGSGSPGALLECDSRALVVACGEGALSLDLLQLPGGRTQEAPAAAATLCSRGHRFD